MNLEKVDISNLSYDEFFEKYQKPGIPVVFKNASSVWGKHTLSPSYFKENFGNKKLYCKKEYTVNEIINIIESSTVENPPPYPLQFNIYKDFPELLPILSPLHMNYAVPNLFWSKLIPAGKFGNDTEIFFGGVGARFPCAHIDFYYTNAWITQLYGRKRFIVFPREDYDYLYPLTNPCVSEVDIFNPDFEKHPEYKKATPISVILEPNETIFVPNGIFHTTESLSPNISLVYDQVNKYNYSKWIKDYSKSRGKIRGNLMRTYMNVVKSLHKI